MISKKMRELIEQSSAVRAMFEEGKKMEAQLGSENVFDFSLGNPNLMPSEKISDEIIRIAKEDDAVHGYMNNAGHEDVRMVVANDINRRFHTKYTARNILMTVGAAGGLNVILKVLLDPNDEVIVFAPYFGEYRSYVDNVSGKLVEVSPNPPTFGLHLTELKKKITSKTKAVIINNPNNPTGVVYSKEELESLSSILIEKGKEFGTDIYLLADEPYRELVYDGAEVYFLPKIYENTVICYSYSKSLSLPGERIGYLLMPDQIASADEVIDGASVANRILGFVNAPSLFQKVIAACIQEEPDTSFYEKNRNLLFDSLTKMGFSCVNPKGAFYLFIKSPVEDEREFCKTAKSHGILLVPGRSFGCASYVRLAYCTSYDVILRSLPHFEKLAASYGLERI